MNTPSVLALVLGLATFSIAGATVAYDNQTALNSSSPTIVGHDEVTVQQGPKSGRRAAAPDGPLAGRWENRSSFLKGRIYHSAVLAYEGMIVWGGGSEHQFHDDGALYDPREDRWRPISKENGPCGRWGHAAVWTGREMIIWGGRSSFTPGEHKDDGAIYDPRTDTWRPMTRLNAPEARSQMAAVWTGQVMIVWGGWTDGGACPATGGSYDPRTDTWTPLVEDGAPIGRLEPAFVWTGRELLVWGGLMRDGGRSCGSGGRYDVETRKWRSITPEGAPSIRGAEAVWTGKEMLVWGGSHLDGTSLVNVGLQTGSCYDPVEDAWRPMSTAGAPEGRLYHGAVWTGSELIVWGGGDQLDGHRSSGGRYDPATDHWEATANLHAPSGRALMSSVWTGDGALFYGGSTGGVEAFNETLYYSPDGTSFDRPVP